MSYRIWSLTYTEKYLKLSYILPQFKLNQFRYKSKKLKEISTSSVDPSQIIFNVFLIFIIFYLIIFISAKHVKEKKLLR